MIKKHIVNIGHPRTGTTWLWTHSNFEPHKDKENSILLDTIDFDHYIKYYSQYDISANFQPGLWAVDREIIHFVQQHSTHITFIVDNPFRFVSRFLDYFYPDQDISILKEYVIFSGFLKYRDIVERWSKNAPKFKIFFFEDLEQNPQEFFKNYMEFCEIPVVSDPAISYNTKINARLRQNKLKLDFTADQIEFINNEIDKFQSVVDRNLSHWKNDSN
jgi:hypothetical protein